MSSSWPRVLVSFSSAARDGRCEKAVAGSDKKEPSSSSLITKSTELAAGPWKHSQNRLQGAAGKQVSKEGKRAGHS